MDQTVVPYMEYWSVETSSHSQRKCRDERRPGENSHIRRTWLLVEPFSRLKIRFWYRLGYSGSKDPHRELLQYLLVYLAEKIFIQSGL